MRMGYIWILRLLFGEILMGMSMRMMPPSPQKEDLAKFAIDYCKKYAVD